MIIQRTSFSHPEVLSRAPAPAPSPEPEDGFEWRLALQAPAYTYGTLSAALSGLSAFADRFPPGGITINPRGIHRNPEWTRAFTEGSFLRFMQPWVAGASAGVHLVRGVLELNKGQNLAGMLDLSLSASSLLSITAPGTGAALSTALLLARGAVEIHA
ncbi:MAG: hypothetical protein HY319_19165 [Armatimonadetes bacterium]|nr:hypothetical protein [Armatimonadota bacterium]